MIGVIDYDAGNLRSVSNALKSIGVRFRVSSSPAELVSCDGIILPGVGAAPGAMASLHTRGLTEWIRNWPRPFLGICLGMQVLFERSEEGNTECLGVFPGGVKKFDDSAVRIPHMGWNKIELFPSSRTGIEIPDSYFYFAHSFYVPVNDITAAAAECGAKFSAVVQKANFTGVQFHPEKSGAAGLSLLRSFAETCESFRQ
jgi:glutamine amidotransferase